MTYKEFIESEKQELYFVFSLTGKEVDLLRNVLSDVQKDKIGMSLNLKIANAILDALSKLAW